ncbi:glycoside hydrolase family 43 protein [Prevotella sp.]|uniref:glycoside hydrolase family 43 protein n=1 Tax=Prevotella sp. TaxID=59823 RepID=UPI003DA39ED4
MKKIITMLFSLLPFAVMAQYHSEVWCPDNGDGTYTNPVINADYSDPDVCAVGGDYYMTASSFNCIPGLPILHSKDLVNWEIVGHALQQLTPKEYFDVPRHGEGVWAPSIRYHNGYFYIYWGNPDYGVYMVKTKNPKGTWDEPVCVIAGKGMIDTCPLWDDNGRCYLVNGWAASRAGFNSVLTVRELSSDGTRVIGMPRIVFDGGQVNHTTEGPKFYKRNGWYWIMCPAGGVKYGWQLAMRSRSPYGPYEWKKVMAQGTTDINGPHQGAWVHTEYGEDWFLHFNDRYEYGRVIYLQPMHWINNWPVMGVDKDGDLCGEPVIRYRKSKSVSKLIMNPQENDEFNNGEIGLQWQWHANYNQFYGMPTSEGCMRLYTRNLSENFVNLWEAPNLLLQKTPAEIFTATAKIRFASKGQNQYGGIIVMGMDYSALVVNRIGNSFHLQHITCNDADKSGRETTEDIAVLEPTERDTIPYSPALYIDLYLQMKISNGTCQFAYSIDGKCFNNVGLLFKMREGKWIGAKIGLVSESKDRSISRGWLDVDWFRITSNK